MQTTSLRPRRDATSIAEIDHEIQYHEEAARELRTRRNSLASIAILPPEILSRVFRFASILWQTYKHSTTWTVVTHVCRRWRLVALDHPALWTDIDLSFSRDWVQAMLIRSKEAPLNILNANINNWSRHLKSLRDVLEHFPRIRTFHLAYSSSAEVIPVLEGLSSPALQLHSLSLTSQDHIRANMTPANFLAGGAPRLRKLVLAHCIIPWESPIYQNLQSLTHLTIQQIPDNRRIAGVETLVTMLATMTALKSLIMTQSLPLFSDMTAAVNSTPNHVHLRELAHLELGGTILECGSLLNYLSFPSQSSIKLHGYHPLANSSWSHPYMSPIISTLARSFSGPSAAHIHRLQLTSVSSIQLQISAWSNDSERNNTPDGNDRCLDLTLYLSESHTDLLALCLSAMSLSHLRNLTVSLASPISLNKEQWVLYFGSLPALEDIRLEEDVSCWAAFIAAFEMDPTSKLQGQADGASQGGPSKSYFPSLECVHFTQIRFDRNEEMFNSLKSALERRLSRTPSSLKLEIVECYHFNAEQSQIINNIDGVIGLWDGEEMSSDEDGHTHWGDDSDDEYAIYGHGHDYDYDYGDNDFSDLEDHWGLYF